MQVIVDYDGRNKLTGYAHFKGSFSSRRIRPIIEFLDNNCEDSAGLGCTHFKPFERHNVTYWFEIHYDDKLIRCSSFEAAKWLLEKAEID